MSLITSVAIGSGWAGVAGGKTSRRSRLPTLYAMTPKSRRAHSSHSFGELAFLDEAPACALRSAPVVARTGNAEDVADHHVVMPRNVLLQLSQEVVLLDAAWTHERADVVPVRTVQRHHRPIPTEADDMAVLAQLDEIEQLHRTLADLQCLIHVERVHHHSGFPPATSVYSDPKREGPSRLAGFGCPPRFYLVEYAGAPLFTFRISSSSIFTAGPRAWTAPGSCSPR